MTKKRILKCTTMMRIVSFLMIVTAIWFGTFWTMVLSLTFRDIHDTAETVIAVFFSLPLVLQIVKLICGISGLKNSMDMDGCYFFRRWAIAGAILSGLSLLFGGFTGVADIALWVLMAVAATKNNRSTWSDIEAAEAKMHAKENGDLKGSVMMLVVGIIMIAIGALAVLRAVLVGEDMIMYQGISFSARPVSIIMMIVCGILGCVFRRSRGLLCKAVGITALAVSMGVMILNAIRVGNASIYDETIMLVLFVISADLNRRTITEA